MFQKLDKDRDGVINQADLKVALKQAGYDHLPSSTFNDFVSTLDTNKDHVITFDEFRSFLLLLPKPTCFENVLEYYTVHQTTNPRPPLTVNQDADADLEVLKASRVPANAPSSQHSHQHQESPEASSSKEQIKDENDVTEGGIFDNVRLLMLARGILLKKKTCVRLVDIYLLVASQAPSRDPLQLLSTD